MCSRGVKLLLDPHFRVSGVRECFSYKQCLLYLMQTSQVGSARSHRAFLLRHSLHASSDDPMYGISEKGSLSTATEAPSLFACAGLLTGKLASMMRRVGNPGSNFWSKVDCHLPRFGQVDSPTMISCISEADAGRSTLIVEIGGLSTLGPMTWRKGAPRVMIKAQRLTGVPTLGRLPESGLGK